MVKLGGDDSLYLKDFRDTFDAKSCEIYLEFLELKMWCFLLCIFMFLLIYHNQGHNFRVKYPFLTLDYVGNDHFGHHLMSLGIFYGKYFLRDKKYSPLIPY